MSASPSSSPEHLSLTARPGASTSQAPAAVSPPPAKRKAVLRRLGLPRFHGGFVIAVTVPEAPSFAAADVRRPLLAEARVAEAGNRLLVPAAIGLLLLVAASGSFLFLVQRARRGWIAGMS